MSVGNDTEEEPGHGAVLERLGLAPTETAVYLSALGTTGAGSSELAVASGLPEAQVHRALGRLQDLGLGSLEDDAFTVAPPHAAIDSLITRRQDELTDAARVLEESRNHVGGVLEAYLARFRRPVGAGIELLEGVEGVQALVRRMAETATRSVVTVMPSLPKAEGVRASREADLLAQRRGVDIRIVVPADAAADGDLMGLLAERVRHGARVRLHHSPPLHCLLVDDECAIVPCDPSTVPGGAWVVRDPGLLRPVRLLVEGVWAAGLPVHEGHDGQPTEDEVRVREVFRLLGRGLKDETVARRMDTSVRTVRRLVAEGMRLLGADSRLEAGVLAQRSGWLDG